jgi:hypothetical protein
MQFDKDKNCDTCKHGYFLDFSLDGYHNLCGAGECYLCAKIHRKCDSYEQGEAPDNSEPMQNLLEIRGIPRISFIFCW